MSAAPDLPDSWHGRTTKLSVSVPESLADAVRERAGGGGVSGYVTDALIRQIELDRLRDLVDDIADDLGGAPTDDEIRTAGAAWPDR